MIRQDPILIASPPRSGTTVLAAVLNAHSVWVGRGRTTRYPGTNMKFASENTDIKVIMKEAATRYRYTNWEIPLPNPSINGTMMTREVIKDKIEKFVPKNTPWLVKTSWCLTFWKFWASAYPKARWLFPVRDIDKIIDSMNRHPGMAKHPDKEKQEYVMALQNARFDAMMEVNYHCFNIEKFVANDRETLAALFTFLDIPPNRGKIRGIIKPEMLKI